MTAAWHKTLSASEYHEIHCGIRLRSWALPMLITFTDTLQEIAIGPFYVARELVRLPF